MLNYNDINYITYLKSFKWKLIIEFMKRKYLCCQLCQSTENLVVHHINYGRYPFEEEKDLVLLCKKCHHEHHKEHKSGLPENSQEIINYLNNLEKEENIFNLKKISQFLRLRNKCDEDARNKREKDRNN